MESGDFEEPTSLIYGSSNRYAIQRSVDFPDRNAGHNSDDRHDHYQFHERESPFHDVNFGAVRPTARTKKTSIGSFLCTKGVVRRRFSNHTAHMTKISRSDPLSTLREYSAIAPWNLKGLVHVAGQMLDVCAIRPTNEVAAERPTERAVRYYVSKGLIPPPEGKGTAAVYSYRHLLQLLAVKLRQMEGAALDSITSEMERTTGDVIERRVSAALGSDLPPPRILLTGESEPNRGKLGRATHSWKAQVEDPAGEAAKYSMAKWYRIPVSSGLELHVHEGHPLAKRVDEPEDISAVIRTSIKRFLAQ